VRQAKAERWQAVLLDAFHLAEGAVMTIGQEHRIVAEAGGAARRPHQRAVDARFDLFEMIVGPGDAKRGNEMSRALLRRGRAALLQQAFDLRHRSGKIF
jgi:methylmalonyl-CoA mutase N-terminal domain/subunit